MRTSKLPLLVGLIGWTSMLAAEPAARSSTAESLAAMRLPSHVAPQMFTWFWRGSDVMGSSEDQIDMLARHAGANLMIMPFRARDKEVTDETVRDEIAEMVRHAAKSGIRVIADVDVRLARQAFRRAYPDELQQMLRLREIATADSGEVTLTIKSEQLADHYTHHPPTYIPLAGKLVRVYAYQRGPQGIEPSSVRDITDRCTATAETAETVAISIPGDSENKGLTACVMVSFTHLTPDMFAPHLLAFQRKIIQLYRDLPLAGACKDEWGFPPCFDGNPAHDDYWYSPFMAQAYAEQTGGRDLLHDCLLMTYGQVGKEAERLAAINQFNELCRNRDAAIEADFYEAVKAAWGPEGFVATHPTWWPYPDRREFKKNGLAWWMVRRDWAQTDEMTPYCVRTALAKKCSSAAWYNMYYSTKLADYQAELWAGALTGGRVNYHEIYPADPKVIDFEERYRMLLRGQLMRGDCRVRLLNFITGSPLDCPVAVIFGQHCAMNWAGTAYDDVGIGLSNALWQAGYPADLIPTTEIENGSLTVSEDGYVQYGPQRYRGVVLYHPDLDKAVTAEFFQKAGAGKSTLYRVGDWTRDFAGRPFDGVGQLPGRMVELKDAEQAAARIIEDLQKGSVAANVRADRVIEFAGTRSAAPPLAGESRLVDGTHIIASGAESAGGDPIQRTLHIDRHEVSVDAIGLFAIRFGPQGHIEAVAAGGLKSLHVDGIKLELAERVDIALWRDLKGRFQGAIQGDPQDRSAPIPAPLRTLTENWRRLSVPAAAE